MQPEVPKVAGSLAMAEYDNFYDPGYVGQSQSAGDMYMEPYLQPVAAEATYGQYGQYGLYGSAGSQMMSGELVLLGLIGLFLTMICAVLVCAAGAAMGWFSSSMFASRTQRTKVDRWEEQV